uniref:Uncharacterized protein n=1 Tax=Arion vulgaris TaxID=1028688 RepID=A0A0B7A0Q5_9EUPU
MQKSITLLILKFITRTNREIKIDSKGDKLTWIIQLEDVQLKELYAFFLVNIYTSQKKYSAIYSIMVLICRHV